MRKVHTVLAGLLLAAAVVQMYFAAVGAFDRPQDDQSYTLHSMNGMMIMPLLSLLTTIVAAVARAPGRQIGLAILPLGLILVQALIVVTGKALGDATGNATPVSLAVFGLHAINGMAIMGVCGAVFRQARLRMADAPAAPVSPAGGPAVRAS
ncbi:DUF6220 domain-containing protein [Sphaerimonospora mesophila]|uniref:DUF6220 domain-containing protein n=1 Tax=Sphaerimonospora mesophila TaxID=37483 RepID=UPI0006E2FB2A